MPVSTVNLPWPVRSSVEALSPLSRVNPDMRQPGAWPGRRLVVQFGVLLEGRLLLAVGDDGVRLVALVHLDAMRVELIDLEGDRLADAWRAALRLPACRRSAHPCSTASSPGRWQSSRPSALKIGPNSSIDLLARGDDLLGDRRALLRIAVEQFRAGLALDRHGRASRRG